jgi:nifR3 family TIM-barrel protein
MGAGLYVAEMLHARGLTERNARTLHMASFGQDEEVRSIQIFGSVPEEMGAAARFLVEELGAHHIDINMGCPVRKVTSRGGGSALPARPELMRRVLAAVVAGAGKVPVTAKIRLGLDDARPTWRDAADVCADEGLAWLGLHARTSAQLYAGQADWDAIARLKDYARLPILGNGDIWESFDALRMMRATGCDGVIIGRGCLGRPWLFRELAQVFDGQEPEDPPTLGEVVTILREHAGLLVDFFEEYKGVRELRKWCAWYTKGFDGAHAVRGALQSINSLADMDAALARLNPELPFPQAALRMGRGKRGRSQGRVALPEGWLDQDSTVRPAQDGHVTR